MDTLEFPPFDTERIAKFAALMGDDNPLHREGDGRTAAQVLLPGALMSVLAERTVAALRNEQHLVQMNLLFVRPVKAGAGLTCSLRDGPHINLGCQAARRVRLTARTGDRLCLMADCILVERGPIQNRDDWL